MHIKTRILTLGFLASFSLLCADGFVLWTEYGNKTSKREALIRIEKMAKLSALINELQLERGISTGYLAVAPSFKKARLVSQQSSTREAKNNLESSGAEKIEGLKTLNETQGKVTDRQIETADLFAWYSLVIAEALEQIDTLERLSTLPKLKTDLHSHFHLLTAKEHLAQIRANLTEFLPQNIQKTGSISALGRQFGLYRHHAESFQRSAAPALREAYELTLLTPQTQDTFATIAAIMKMQKVKKTAGEWFTTISTTIDQLGEIESQSLSHLNSKVTAEIKASDRRLWLVIFMTLGATLLFLLVTITTIRRLLSSLGNLVSSIQHTISTHDFSNRIVDAENDEIGIIARNFNELLAIAEQLIHEKDHLASTDSLTGALNRRKFPELFAGELQTQSSCEGIPIKLSLITFDIDHFKKINDSLGHAAGDLVLKEVACLARGLIRKTDVLARWGGEEFMILVPNVGIEAAGQLAEKLRSAIEKNVFPEGIKVTVSFGVSEYRPDDTLETLCGRADEALYLAKNEGRNRVCLEIPLTKPLNDDE